MKESKQPPSIKEEGKLETGCEAGVKGGVAPRCRAIYQIKRFNDPEATLSTMVGWVHCSIPCHGLGPPSGGMPQDVIVCHF